MALQSPAAGTATAEASPTHTAATASQPFLGPFIRFAGGTGPQDGRGWRGSVLCGTRDGAGGAGGGAAATDAGGDDQPTLELSDSGGGGAASPRRLAPALLHGEQGWRFWRFELELELPDVQRPVRYTVHAGEWERVGGRTAPPRVC